MKTTRIKTSPVNQGQKSSKKEQARKTMQDIGDKTPVKDKLVGGSGAFGLIGGSGGKVAKGAFQTIKKLLTRGSKSKAAKSTDTFREIANESLRRGLNKGDKINPTY